MSTQPSNLYIQIIPTNVQSCRRLTSVMVILRKQLSLILAGNPNDAMENSIEQNTKNIQ